MKVLIIEDEVAIRENVQEILEAQGFDVVVTDTGVTGVAVAQAEDAPDIILCDIMMPELDGYGVLQELRQNAATATIPLIFLTAKTDRAALRQGMTLGADDYLTKPFTRTELLQAISTQLRKRVALSQKSQQTIHRLGLNIACSFPREILTPLKEILGMTQLLIEDHGLIEPAEALEMAEMIYESGQTLDHLMQNFLIYTNLELLLADPEQVQLYRSGRNTCLVKELITDVALQRAMKDCRVRDLHLEIPNAIVAIGELDLKKALEEIIDNAFKFSLAGTSVKVIASIVDHCFNLQICDQGHGLTTEELSQLAAYRQFNRKVYEQKGCGLGMAIACRIVELYGGTFRVESIPQKQTAVHLSFPCKPLYTTLASAVSSIEP